MPKKRPQRRRRLTASTHPIVRQLKLIQRLTEDAEGVAVAEFAEEAGTSQKTIRRDLHLIREVGFDLKETVGEFGKKYWRIRHPFDKLRSKRKRYALIRDSLDLLITQADQLGDKRLADDVRAIRKRVVRKCR